MVLPSIRNVSKHQPGTWDAVGIAMSGLCLVHCLLLPLLVAVTPTISVVAGEGVHQMLLLVLVPPLLLALVRGRRRHGRDAAAALLLTGLALLVAGAFLGIEDWEVPLTVAGSLAVIIGHALNAWWCRSCPACEDAAAPTRPIQSSNPSTKSRSGS